MNRRNGRLLDLKDTGKNKKRIIFHAPTRGLMGYTSRFLTLTKGTGVINIIFHSFGDFTGDMEGRRNSINFHGNWKCSCICTLIYKLEERCHNSQ